MATLLLATLITSCSDDPYDDYCSVVKDQQVQLSDTLSEGGPNALLKALPIFEKLRDAAPSDIKDDWKVVVDGLTKLADALDDAGVDPATYDRKDPPPGLTADDKKRIDAAAQALTTDESVAAFASVEQQARDVCKTPLNI